MSGGQGLENKSACDLYIAAPVKEEMQSCEIMAPFF